VCSAAGERVSRPGSEISHGPGGEQFARAREACDARGDVDADAGDVVAIMLLVSHGRRERLKALGVAP
jgi:hypothetical protein